MLLDYLKRPISIGAKVVYPGRSGSSLWLTTGNVIAIDEDYRWGYRKEKIGRIKVLRQPSWDSKQREVWLEHLDRVVVVDVGETDDV